MDSYLTALRTEFTKGVPYPYKYRISALKALKTALVSKEAAIFAALKKDLARSPFLSKFLEVDLVLNNIEHHLKNLHS